MSKIKVLQIYCYDYTIHAGGLEKIAQTLRQWLNKVSDIIVTDLTSDMVNAWVIADTKYTDVIHMPSLEIVSWYPIPKFRSSKFWQILRQIKNYKPDIIQTHTRFFLYTLLWGMLAKARWIKRIHVEHGSGFVTWYPRYITCIARLFDWTVGLWIFRYADRIVTISQSHKQFIQKFTSKDPIVIYNPIDYIPKPRVKNTIPHIGFVGRLASIKWVDVLIHALKHLQEKDWICTIVWEGDQREKLQTLAQKLWLQDRIAFVWADDRTNWLHKFDIFVNPSYQEWLPTTVVEALLAWCVVVATDVGGTREISDKSDLNLVLPWSIDSLVQWLAIALNWNKKEHAISKNLVKRKFALGTSIDAYIKVAQYLSH